MGDDEAGRGREQTGAGSALIYCGLCGALNPASHHFCAACGSTLVDAFSAVEGLRVFERADPASRVIEILPSGDLLDLVEDPDAPAGLLILLGLVVRALYVAVQPGFFSPDLRR